MTVTWRSRSCEVIEYPVVRVVGSVTNVIALCRERKLEKRCLHVWSWVYRSACLVVLLVIVWTSLLGATVFTPRSTAWHHAWADKVASSQAASTKQTSMRLFQSNTHLGVVSFCERFTTGTTIKSPRTYDSNVRVLHYAAYIPFILLFVERFIVAKIENREQICLTNTRNRVL